MTTEMVLSARGPIGITASPEGLRLSSPYDAAFVEAFKRAIPSSGRRWDGQKRQWLVDPVHGAALVREIETFFGVAIDLPRTAVVASVPVTDVVQLAYLGACKTRDDGSVSASGYTLGNRNAKAPDLVFAESVLRAWFDGGMSATQDVTARAKPAPPASLYAVLCVPADVDAAALKSAYRRMARQTHPDVNKEPDAADAFRRVQHAYDVLSDTIQRRKYDAGLALEARAKEGVPRRDDPFLASLRSSVYGDSFRAPLRCGLLLVTGTRRLGRMDVQTIHSWQDLIQNDRVLVSSWPPDATVWTENWIDA